MQKILHFMWLGDNPIPEYAEANIALWTCLNPDYTVHFWTEKNRPMLEPEQEWSYSNARNFGERADVLRHNLIYLMGGYTVDLDIKPIASMSFIETELQNCTQVIGSIPTAVLLQDGSRFFGGPKYSPFFKLILSKLPIVIKNAIEKWPNLRAAFTGHYVIDQCLKESSEMVMILPGKLFPTKNTEVWPETIGVHDFAGESFKV